MTDLFPKTSTGFMTMADLSRVMFITADIIEDIKAVFEEHNIELMEGGNGKKTASYTQNGFTPDYVYFTITLRNFNQVDPDAELRKSLTSTTRLELIEDKTICNRHWVGYYKVKTFNEYRTNIEDVTAK